MVTVILGESVLSSLLWSSSICFDELEDGLLFRFSSGKAGGSLIQGKFFFRVCAAVILGLSPLLASAASDLKVPVQVTLVSPLGLPPSGGGFVSLHGPAASKPILLPIKLPDSATAELPAGSQWTVLADFPGYFASPAILQIPQAPSPGPLEVPLTLRPAGTLTGKLVVTGKEKLPESLDVRFEPTRETPGKKQDLPAGSAACAISPAGDLRCRVPAGSLDLALHPKGFVPHYFWNRGVKAGETISLGSLKLQRGASVAGWINREDGTPSETCRVRLEPATAPGRPNDPVLDFLRSVASEAPCQKKGFFQFTAVKPGSYAVVAEEKGARAHMSPVEVWDGAESRLTIPIVLRRPADFEVTLSPPTDWLGRPWRVEAIRANEYRAGWEDPPYKTEADELGRARLAKQSPGRFWINVYDRLGNAVFSDPYVNLSDPAQPYPITIDLLWVEGTVHLGDEPVVATLFFGGRSGMPSVKMTSDAKGRFEGPLPRAGRWQVDIESSKPRLRTAAKVEVKQKGDRASVAIELPDTKVYGRVVTPSGEPAANAKVTLSSVVDSLEGLVDGKGEFEIRAFPAGTNELYAERPGGEGTEVSEIYRFEAVSDSPHGPVVLTLRQNRVLRGKVLSATGPVVGASISAWPTLGGGGAVLEARSRLDGSFELRVPVDTQAIQAVVSPPAGALKTYEMSVPKEAELLLQVESQGGEIVVDFDGHRSERKGIVALWQGGVGVPFGALVRWMEAHGQRYQPTQEIRIPQLAPGAYTACLGAPALVDIEVWKSKAKCASGYLAPGSTLDLQLR